MQFKIPEQVFTLDEGGYGRIRFEMVTEKVMADEPATTESGTPEDTSSGVETAAVETTDTSSTPSDQGIQALAEVAKPEDVTNG